MQHWFGKEKKSRNTEGMEECLKREERVCVHTVVWSYQQVV
jgi:hypothetical protein